VEECDKLKSHISSINEVALKREGVTADWVKLRNEALHYLYPHPVMADQIKVNEVGRACSTHVGEESCIQGVVGESRRKTIWKT
jgi:hypothetical protein